MIPRIPEGCERFYFDEDHCAWYFQDELDLWKCVEYILRESPQTTTERHIRQNICNAARCAWLDEAENILHRQHRPVIAMYRYWDGLTYWESGITDPVRLQYREWPAWEIDYAHCLAWAEAWAREAKG